MWRSARRRFEASWNALGSGARRGRIDQVAEALLAYQFQERDGDGRPSDLARLGALWTADYQIMHRAFMRGFSGGDKE